VCKACWTGGSLEAGGSVTLANPSRVVQGDRVTHLLFDVTT
jgi:hypothetical protein